MRMWNWLKIKPIKLDNTIRGYCKRCDYHYADHRVYNMVREKLVYCPYNWLYKGGNLHDTFVGDPS